MGQVTYWVVIAMILALAVAFWGWKNMSDREKSALGLR